MINGQCMTILKINPIGRMNNPYYQAYSPYPNVVHSNAMHHEHKPDTGFPGHLASMSQPGTPRPEDMSPIHSETLSQPTSPIADDGDSSRRPSASSRSSSMSSIMSGRRSRRADHGMSVKGGPLFTPTKQLVELWTMDRSAGLQVHLNCRIDRGFFLADNDWTCYRRNYFQISGAFDMIQDMGYIEQPDLPCCIKTENGFVPVQHFLFGIGARVADSDKRIDIVQHTPKRDKGPQIVPAPKPIRPGGHLGPGGGINPPNHQVQLTSLVSFERLQFKTATANNGKRRAAQQYYEIVVELLAHCQNNQRYKIATCHTAPLVVRGRSPGHYSDNLSRQSNGDSNDERFVSSQHARHPMSPGAQEAYGTSYSPYPSPYPYHYGPLVSPPVRSDGMPMMMPRYPQHSLDMASPDEHHSPVFHSPGGVDVHSPDPNMHHSEAMYHSQQTHQSSHPPLGLNIHTATDSWNRHRADNAAAPYYAPSYPTTPSSAGPHLPPPQYPTSAFEPRSGGASLSKYQMKIDIPPSNHLSNYQPQQQQQQYGDWPHGEVDYQQSPSAGSTQEYGNPGDTPTTELGKGVMNMSFRMGKMEAADNL
ncbi:unnamed protein product [Umbelopsis ramanniana]